MSNDVLITPASRKIEFKDSSGNVDAVIQTDSSGNLSITNTGGDLSLGDTTSDIFVGDGTNNIDLVFEQNGEIRGTSGVTVTVGASGSTVNLAGTVQLGGTTISSTGAELNILDGVTATATELNIMDGVTATTAELNILDGVTATATELNLIDGVTATTAELNILDGVTATATELNYVDGVTSAIQTQLDTKPTKHSSGGIDTLEVSGTNARCFKINADLGTNENRPFEIKTPASDDANAPYQINTNNTLAFQTDGTNRLTVEDAGIIVTGAITVSGTVDGRDIATDGTKLDGIESSATADQTASEIRTLVESASDSNVFTDADHTKLNGVASSATANPNALDNVSEDTSPQLGGNLDLNSNDITGTGNINITGTLQTSSDAIIGGDLTVSGTTTTVNTETINLADNNIVLNSNLSSSTAPSENGGITINRGSATDKVFQWNESTDYWEVDDVLEIDTASGYVQIGPRNTSYAHIYTDRPRYYFNKQIIVDGGIVGSYDEDLNLNRTSSGALSSTERIRITSGTTHSDQDFHVSNASGSELRIDTEGGTNADSVLNFRENTVDRARLYWDGADNDLYLETTVGDIALMPTGNVGIGTTSPDGLLHVSSGTSGDATVIIEADTDNNEEGDIPQLWFKADGDITEGAIRLNDNELQIANNVSTGEGIEFLTGTTNNTGTTDPFTGATKRMGINASGIDVTGNIAVSGTVDGRDLATDGTKLDGIEASADVTDTANVTSAGALMDSEVTNLAQVKAFASSDYATAAQGATADAALPKAGGTMTGNIIFEGATADAHETTLAVTDPTADRTITLPDATGTVILNTNLNFPFFKADGSSDTIALTADNKLPFTKSDGSASNIALTT